MINLTREEAQQVLGHLDDLADAQQWEIDMHVTQCGEEYKPHRMKHMREKVAITNKTIETLRARLAQPEPEPVAWHELGAYGNVTVYKDWAKENGWQPFYTVPPQREWVGLTKKETLELLEKNIDKPFSLLVAVRDKLKEKNG